MAERTGSGWQRSSLTVTWRCVCGWQDTQDARYNGIIGTWFALTEHACPGAVAWQPPNAAAEPPAATPTLTALAWYTVEAIPEVAIQDFAAQHRLSLVVHERRVGMNDPMRYYAAFKSAEVKGDGVLRSEFGDGRTPDAAIVAYTARISLSTLVIDALRGARREIAVPRLYYRLDDVEAARAASRREPA